MEKERITNICNELKVDGVITTTEAPIATCGYITEQLCLNGITYETARCITNKFWVREKARNCIIKQPDYILIYEDNSDIAKEWHNYPAVAKPVNGGGKRGVIIVNNAEDVRQCVEYAKSYDRNDAGVLLEKLIAAGKEYSVEALSYNGKHQIIQITEKISSGPPHFVELGHHQPAQMCERMKQKVSLAICGLLDAVDYRNGSSHTEIKIVNDDVYLIELNARPGGDHIAAKLVELSTGYDYIGESIKVALNIEPSKYENKADRHAGVYFVTQQTAFLKPIFDSCDNEKWLYEKHIESEELNELTHNDCLHTNYIIYCSNERVNLGAIL